MTDKPLTANDLQNLQMLDMEYRLTIGHRLSGEGCDCVRYFISRRDVLIPAVMRRAMARDIDPVDLFAGYARKVHARHESGLSLAVTA